METELVTIPSHPGTTLALFTSEGGKDLDPLLAEVREKIDSWNCPGTDTKKSRDEIASFAFKVVRSKTALEKVGKELAAQAKLIPGKIDASRRRINATLDQWAAEVRAPLTEWEIAEDARIKRHRQKLDELNAIVIAPLAGFTPTSAFAAIRNRISLVEALIIGPVCEEFEADYARAKDAALRALRTALADRERYDAEQAELARLRAAEAEREAVRKKEAEAAAAVERERVRREREATIAAEATERARLKAESDAQKERERREYEARAAERAAQQEREVAARREQALRDEAAAAERRAAEADARAKRETERARLKAESDAQKERERREYEARAAERAAQQEREVAARREQALRDEAAAAERRAAEADARAKREIAEAAAAADRRAKEQAAAEKAESERREANKRHAATVNRKARDALVGGGLAEEAATLAVTLIASRKVPGVVISY